MAAFMQTIREKVVIGLVGGSDLKKITEQMGEDGEKKHLFKRKNNKIIFLLLRKSQSHVLILSIKDMC